MSNVIWLAKTETAYPIGKRFLDIVWSACAKSFATWPRQHKVRSQIYLGLTKIRLPTIDWSRMKMADNHIFWTMCEQYFYLSGPILMQIFSVAVVGKARWPRTWPTFTIHGISDKTMNFAMKRSMLAECYELLYRYLTCSIRYKNQWPLLIKIFGRSSSWSSENEMCPSWLTYRFL